MGVPILRLNTGALQQQGGGLMESYQKAMGIKGLMQEQQMRQMQMEAAKQQQADQQSIQAVLADPSIDWTKPEEAIQSVTAKATQAGVSQKTLFDIRDSMRKDITSRMALDKATREKQQEDSDIMYRVASNIMEQPTPESQASAYSQGREQLIAQRIIKPEMMPEQYNPAWVAFHRGAIGLSNAAFTLALNEEKRKAEAEKAQAEAKMATELAKRTPEEIANLKNLASTSTSDIKNYEFAVKEGYKGSFEQWQKDEANRKAIRLTTGGETEAESMAAAEDYADSLEAGSLQWAQVPVSKGMRNRVVSIIKGRGAVILTTKQREGLQSSERAKSIIDSIDTASKRVHSGATFPGQKWASGAAETAASIAAPAGNPDLDALQAGAAALGPIIRNLGEMGNLSEGDIERAVAAVPVSRFLTRKEAEARLKILREFVSASKNAIKVTAGVPSRQLLGGEDESTPRRRKEDNDPLGIR